MTTAGQRFTQPFPSCSTTPHSIPKTFDSLCRPFTPPSPHLLPQRPPPSDLSAITNPSGAVPSPKASFIDSSVELKAHIVRLAREQDLACLDPEEEGTNAAHSEWYGRSTVALRSVNKELCKLAAARLFEASQSRIEALLVS